MTSFLLYRNRIYRRSYR